MVSNIGYGIIANLFGQVLSATLYSALNPMFPCLISGSFGFVWSYNGIKKLNLTKFSSSSVRVNCPQMLRDS